MREAWFTAAEIAHLQGWKVSYVYKLACVHQWRRKACRPVRYHLGDVMESAPERRR